MSLPATIAQAILDTVIGRLAILFLAGAAGDMTAAREAAHQMLAAYNPGTPDELTLAAEIVSLQFHTLEALSYAADPDLPLNKKIRLRGSAVSLSRESHKAQRKLDQLQHARRANMQVQPAQAPTPPSPAAEAALDLVETAREAIRIAQKTGGQNWSQTLQKRLMASRMAEKVKKNQAEYQARTARLDPPVPSAPAALPAE